MKDEPAESKGILETLLWELNAELGKRKEEWDWAFVRGQKLHTLINTNAWIYAKMKLEFFEYSDLSGGDRMKVEIKERLAELWKDLKMLLDQSNTVVAEAREAVETVRDCDCEEGALGKINEGIERLRKLRMRKSKELTDE